MRYCWYRRSRAGWSRRFDGGYPLLESPPFCRLIGFPNVVAVLLRATPLLPTCLCGIFALLKKISVALTRLPQWMDKALRKQRAMAEQDEQVSHAASFPVSPLPPLHGLPPHAII
jgi:hypothetical protein